MDKSLKTLVDQMLESYAHCGGIKHLNGCNLPSKMAVAALTRDLLHVIFPGFIAEHVPSKEALPAETELQLLGLQQKLEREITRSLEMQPVEGLDAAAVTLAFLRSLTEVRKIIQTDVEAAYQGDPAATSPAEIILAYPGIEAVTVQRLAHRLYRAKVPVIPRMMTEWAHSRTGIDIHPGAEIGSHFFIDHGTGVVIGETCQIGNHVKLYHGVTLGARSFAKDDAGHIVKGGKRHPNVSDNVTIYPNSTILGGETVIGENSTIGANVFLMHSVPPNSLVVHEPKQLSIMDKSDKGKKPPLEWSI